MMEKIPLSACTEESYVEEEDVKEIVHDPINELYSKTL
jgi:hypothetical protein